MKFQIICCDPPYVFNDRLSGKVKRGAEANYSIMSINDIKNLPIQDITDPDGSLLALWVPSSLLDDGIKIMNAWKFDFKQTWIWVKIKKDPFKKLKKDNNISGINWDDFLSFGMGRLGRNVHEVVIIGTRGSVYKNIKNKSQRTVFFAPNEKHSKKPELLQDKLELILPQSKKIELFARRERIDWLCLGNEVGLKEDIRLSLEKIINNEGITA